MNIQLDHVIPEPIKASINPDSQVWNTDLILKKGVEYQINAKSGKGKSTLSQILYGIRKDYQGSVLIGDRPIEQISHEDLATMRQSMMSILFQDLRLFLELTPLDNIMLNAELSNQSIYKSVEPWANELGVAHLLHKPMKFLSYGERQRYAIIRSLIQPFEWIILDEPFSHLDQENTEKAYKLILQRSEQQNAGVIITTLGEDHFLKGETVIL